MYIRQAYCGGHLRTVRVAIPPACIETTLLLLSVTRCLTNATLDNSVALERIQLQFIIGIILIIISGMFDFKVDTAFYFHFARIC